MQRREDVQTVLDKLSELQTAISVNNKNNKENDNENILDSKRATQLVKQMVHAITQEKKVNMRFRREVQDQLAEQSKIYASELKSKMDFIEDRCINDMSTKLTRYTEMTTKFVTKTDLLSVKELITQELQIINKKVTEFSSCLELYHAGFTTDGIYKIRIKGRYVDVYCDQTTDGGGWIVFQRRQDGSEGFYRAWSEYKRGFGDPDGEFWLGNDNLADLTEDCCHELRVELGDVDGNTRYAKYSEFRVLNEDSLYTLNINGYSGNAGDSLKYHNKMKFSTKDADHDTRNPTRNYHKCAVYNEGAWWFRSCHLAHLNGLYHASGYVECKRPGISWNEWKNKLGNGTCHSLTFSEMKFRANNGHV